jgi:hypothetical protein
VVLASVFELVTWGNAFAHGDHKPKHGGIMGRGDDEISVELVMDKGTAILYVEQDDKPVRSEKLTGTLTIAARGRPAHEVKLVPVGENKLMATGLTPVRGDRLKAHIVFPDTAQYISIFSFR